MPRKSEGELEQLFEFLAESVLDVPDEDLLAEVREGGQDPEAVSQRVRTVIDEALAADAKRQRGRLREAYERQVASLQERVLRLPETASEQLVLLKAALTANPGLRAGILTFQYRDLSELSPEDVEGCLRKLHELGVLELSDNSDI